MDSIAEMGIEYNPETMLAKAGMRVAEKEAKKQIKQVLKEVKKELNKSLTYFGFASLDDVMEKVTEIKDEAMDTVQQASEYGITSVINRPLQIIKSIKDLSKSILHPTGDSKSAKIIDKLQEAGVQSVSVVMPQGAFENKPIAPVAPAAPGAAAAVNPLAMAKNVMANPMAQHLISRNPYAQKMMMNPYAQRMMMMRGGKREKEPAEEIEETLNMLINHRLWVLNEAKKKGNKSKAKSKKHTIKKKKMIKNPNKKGTKRRKWSKRR